MLQSFRSRHERVNVSELSRRTQLPEATVCRLVHALEGAHVLERESRGYRLLPFFASKPQLTVVRTR